MQTLLLIISICVLLIVITARIIASVIRVYLRKRGMALIKNICNMPPYCKSIEKHAQHIPDFQIEISLGFGNKVVKLEEIQNFRRYYEPNYLEAVRLCNTHSRFKLTPPDEIVAYINGYGNIDKYFTQHNDIQKEAILKAHKDFFDTCLKYPLDQQQRRSIISEEDNCLVVSSAGSGKTSSIIGKVKYLIEIKGVQPNKILLISYTNKAAAELTERLATPGLRGYTFHKLALDIIGKATGTKPSICDNTDAVFIDAYRRLSQKQKYQKHIVEYFAEHQNIESSAEEQQSKKREQLAEQKKREIKAMLPDMDGKSIYVRSEQESKICFALSRLGIKFRYEEPYEYEVADETHSQYRPDFSIYFEKNGVRKRIYIEHFGVNEHGLVPNWFAKDKGMTYEEANKRYNDGITWKIELHKKYNTTLIHTSSADFKSGNIFEHLKALLVNAGVPINEVNDAELYSLVLPQGSKREKAFIRLIATFVTLQKTSCKSIHDIISQIKESNDERSLFIVKNIYLPMQELYESILAEKGQIDFTDAIIKATELCNTTPIVKYEHIIVDEFQDISIDRYNFLKALRKGDIPAKLYCVGDDWQSIYRFSGSDMSLFNQFADYFGLTEVNKIETTYRFGEPMVSLSAKFIQCNPGQIIKQIRPFNNEARTELAFIAYDKTTYCTKLEQTISCIPKDKSVFLLGRYSFDDILISGKYKVINELDKFYYIINDRKIEFLTAHKSKGLEADYVIILQCNRDTYGFPSLVNDDPTLNYVLTQSDRFPFSEERRLFYVAITRAKIKTFVMYDSKASSVFVDEFIHPDRVSQQSYAKHRNAQKVWTKGEDRLLLTLHKEGKSIKEISAIMGRSQTAIIMRLGKLNS